MPRAIWRWRSLLRPPLLLDRELIASSAAVFGASSGTRASAMALTSAVDQSQSDQSASNFSISGRKLGFTMPDHARPVRTRFSICELSASANF